MPGENMTLNQIRRGPIAAALSLLPDRMTSPEAEVQMLAIGLHRLRLPALGRRAV